MRRAVSSAVLLFLYLVSLSAQVNKGNLTGIVRDTSGAVVPGATLKLVNTGTGAERAEASDQNGLYRFLLLDLGLYRLHVESAGFKTFIRDKIQMTTGETTTVDVTLEVGAVSDQVTVTAESPLLRTETGALGTTINATAVAEIPFLKRNPDTLITLSPGITLGNAKGMTDHDPWMTSNPSNFVAGGSKAKSEFLLDGIPNMKISSVSFNPPADSVAEMRLHTNAFDAEFGHSGAAFINVSTKPGTNEFHGSAYWYLQNDVFNANDFFNNRYGQAKPRVNQNTGGIAIGGPLRFPKIYSGRDRTHYSATYERTIIKQSEQLRNIVPTALERAGDFSKTTDRFGNPFTIYDPATTRPQGSGFIRDPFPGKVIPGQRIDATSAKTTQFYPSPNMTPLPVTLENFQNGRGHSLIWNNFVTRVDHQISNNHQLFARFGWNMRDDKFTPYWGEDFRYSGNPSGQEELFDRGNVAAGLGYTWLWSTNTVIDVRAGLTRQVEKYRTYGDGFDLTKLGLPSSFVSGVTFATFPLISMTDVTMLGSTQTASTTLVNMYHLIANVHTMRGRHTIKYGFRAGVAQRNQYSPGRSSGNFTFNRVMTQGPDPTRAATNIGHGFASFLLGAATSGYVDYNASPAFQNKYYAFYFQEDWKATNRLTLNLGLRVEHDTPVTERYNQGNSGFDPNVASPIESQVRANYAKSPIPELSAIRVKGGLGYLNTSGAPRGNYDTKTLLYAPRFGFAYRLTNRLVWRGGYGIFYDPLNLDNASPTTSGFSLATRMVNSLDDNLTPYNRFGNPFPAGISRPPGAAGGLLTGVGQSVTASGAPIGTVPNYFQALSQQYSTGFQLVLPGQVSVETSYAGNASQRIAVNRNVNQYPDEYQSLKTRLNARVANPFLGVITDKTSALSASTVTVSQLLKPFPQFIGVTQSRLPYGRSHYDSLQVAVTKRASAGLYFGMSYTISKYLEATSYLNANDARPANAVSTMDRPQVLTVHGTYQLPFGAGKRFLNSRHSVLDRVVGGWQVNWLIGYQSMEPLSFSGAERLFSSDKNPYTIDRWFDVSQFVVQAPYTLRRLSNPVPDLHAPGVKKWDLTAIKSVSITEKIRMRIEAQFFNVWNTPQFGPPNTTVTSADFGMITGAISNICSACTYGPRQIQLSTRISW